MNNKYQDALDNRKEAYENMFNILAIEKDNEFYEDIETIQELVDIYPEYLELKARATPEKGELIALDGFNEELASHLCCKSCKKPIVNVWNNKDYKPNFCHYCGKALDWNKDEEPYKISELIGE